MLSSFARFFFAFSSAPFSTSAAPSRSTAAASVFLFLGLISPTEKFMDNLTTVVILVTAMLGGNMIPLDSMPAWMARFGQFGFQNGGQTPGALGCY